MYKVLKERRKINLKCKERKNSVNKKVLKKYITSEACYKLKLSDTRTEHKVSHYYIIYTLPRFLYYPNA